MGHFKAMLRHATIKLITFASLLFGLFCLTISTLGAQTATTTRSKLSPDLLTLVRHGGSQPQPVEVIVQFHRQLPLSGPPNLVSSLGGKILRKLGAIKGAHCVIPLHKVLRLANDPNTAYVSLNRPIHLTSTDRYIQTVGADLAYNSGWTGQGISVAVIDSGISPHPDLLDEWGNSRVIYNHSFVRRESPADLYGHGTHVAGIIAGNGYSSRYDGYDQVKGIAPNAYLVNLKALDQHGGGSDSDVIAAIDRAIRLKTAFNIKVINLSLGRPVYESYLLDPLDRAVEAAYKAGIVVVVAAGNNGREDTLGTNGYGTINAPGNDPYVITVGASNTRDTDSPYDDRIATYSSKGPTPIDRISKPDLVAPGNLLVSLSDAGSTLATEYPQNRDYSQTSKAYSYFTLSGTSMATPVVAGAAALMLQKSPEISPDTIKARMMKTAFKGFVPGYYWYDPNVQGYRYEQHDVFTIGAGLLDIPAALSNSDVAWGPAASPFAVPLTSTEIILTTNSSLASGASPLSGYPIDSFPGTSSATWSSSIIWGSTGAWGASVIWGSGVQNDNGSSIVWGSSVCWGSGNPQSDSVVWGSSTNSLADPAQTSAQGLMGSGDPN